MSKIEKIEEVLTGYAGPFAKSVIKHQMKVLGISKETTSTSELNRLIESVTKKAIFDPVLHEEAKRKLLRIITE